MTRKLFSTWSSVALVAALGLLAVYVWGNSQPEATGLGSIAVGQIGASALVCGSRWPAVAGHGAARPAVGTGDTLLLAGRDEWHQFFLPGRSPSIDDWLADALGVVVGIGISHAIGQRVRGASAR